MATNTTPVFGIAYCDDQTQLKDVAGVTASAATTIEAALVRAGIVPANAADFMAAVAAAGGMGVQAAVTATTGFTGGTGWTVAGVRARKLGFGFASLRMTLTYTGAGFTPGSTGDIGNQVMATLPAAWLPLEDFGCTPHSTGRMWSGAVGTTGSVTLGALPNTAPVVTNEQLTFANMYRLATP